MVTKDNRTKIDILYPEAWNLRYADTPRALVLGKQILASSESINYSRGIARGKLVSAAANFLLSNDENLLEYLTSALAFFESESDREGKLRALNFIANVYDNYGEYENALKHGLKGLELIDPEEDREAEADLLGTIGLIYNRLSDYNHAIDAFTRSLSIREELKNFRAAASSLNLLARTYTLNGDFRNGLAYYRRSLAMREEHNDRGGLPWTYLGMASLYEKMKDDKSASDNYTRSKEINASGDPRCTLHCLMGLGNIAVRNGRAEEAVRGLQQALDIAVSLKAKPLRYEIHLALASAYEKMNDPVKSLEHYKLFHALREEVLNAETTNKLKHQQIGFAIENSKKEAEIFRLKNVELKEAYDKIEEKNRSITDSINYAQRIQHAILPHENDVKKLLPDSFILFKPKDIVSGDFYWAGRKNNRVIIAAADCTGHGVPGAFMSMIGCSLLNQIVKEEGITHPPEILRRLHTGIREALKQHGKSDVFGAETRDGMDVALCSIAEEQSGTILEYAGAMRPLYLFRGGVLQEVKATKLPVGGADYEQERTFTGHTFTLSRGDTFYTFSDGYADQFNADDKKLMTGRFKELLASIQHESMEKQAADLDAFIERWKGGFEQTDDILVIGVRISTVT